jgi:hypothetical protein
MYIFSQTFNPLGEPDSLPETFLKKTPQEKVGGEPEAAGLRGQTHLSTQWEERWSTRWTRLSKKFSGLPRGFNFISKRKFMQCCSGFLRIQCRQKKSDFTRFLHVLYAPFQKISREAEHPKMIQYRVLPVAF